MSRTLHVLLAVAVASPVMAEPPIGSRLGERAGQQRSVEASMLAAQEMTRCMARRRPDEARRALTATVPLVAERAIRVVTREISNCSMSGGNDFADTTRISFPPAVLRGLLADALINESPAAARLPALPIQKSYSRPWFAATLRDPSVDEMATCAADTNPSSIIGLLQTTVTTPEETAAIRVLAPALGQCLRGGVKLQANRQQIRAALAEALYQRAFNPPSASVQ